LLGAGRLLLGLAFNSITWQLAPGNQQLTTSITTP